jgi:hypothetical protein
MNICEFIDDQFANKCFQNYLNEVNESKKEITILMAFYNPADSREEVVSFVSKPNVYVIVRNEIN